MTFLPTVLYLGTNGIRLFTSSEPITNVSTPSDVDAYQSSVLMWRRAEQVDEGPAGPHFTRQETLN